MARERREFRQAEPVETPNGARRLDREVCKMKTNYRIERLIDWELSDVGFGEDHILNAAIGHASSGSADRARIAFYSHYSSRRTNESGRQHCPVTNAAAKIQHTLAVANTRLTKESLGENVPVFPHMGAFQVIIEP